MSVIIPTEIVNATRMLKIPIQDEHQSCRGNSIRAANVVKTHKFRCPNALPCYALNPPKEHLRKGDRSSSKKD